VWGTHRFFQHLRHTRQTVIPGLVTVSVVIKLEIIDIEHNQREGFVLINRVLQHGFHRPPVCRLG
jgi:hypothetical protein